MLEAMNGRLSLLEVFDVMRCVMLCLLEAVEGGLLFAGGLGDAGGDVLCAALYAGNYGGADLSVGVSRLQSATTPGFHDNDDPNSHRGSLDCGEEVVGGRLEAVLMK